MIAYDFNQLDAAAEDCRGAVSNMTSQLDTLESNIQPMLGTWEGSAREEYYRRQKEWDQAAADLRDLLTRIEGSLRKSSESMQARERANTAKFGG